LNSKLHILFLAGWYPSRVLPNNGDFIQRHAEAVNTIHEVSLLHIISDVNCKKKTEYDFKKINGIDTHICYIKPTKNPLTKSIRFFKAFKKMLQKIGDFDVVHLNVLFPFGFFALYLKWFKNKNFIITEHWTDYHQPLVENISSTEIFISKIITKNAKYICTVSEDLKKSMLKLGLSGNYHVVPNVVDVNLFKPKDYTNEVFTILHVSNMLNAHKNVSGIINTIKKLTEKTKNIKLILIGQNAVQYKELVISLNLTNYIEFINHIPQTKLVNYMQKADVFVLFSNYENLPCVILESFSCGTPVISTRVGGISEFFPVDFGHLINVNDENELLKKLSDISAKPIKKALTMHQYVEQNFSPKVIAEQFSILYYKALK